MSKTNPDQLIKEVDDVHEEYMQRRQPGDWELPPAQREYRLYRKLRVDIPSSPLARLRAKWYLYHYGKMNRRPRT